jgi:hypothetical protein
MPFADKKNILGTLGFRCFLADRPKSFYIERCLLQSSSMCWEKRKIQVGHYIETIIASFCLQLPILSGHLSPFAMEADCFQLFYAFAQGIIEGKAYQDSRSVIYPMFMHSISNVLMVGTGYLFLLL